MGAREKEGLMARATFVKKARRDVPDTDIKAGDSYYWWKFRRGGKHFSKTPPKRSQLTQSTFYATVFEIEDTIAEATADDGLPDVRDDVASQLRELASECESNRSNMPESLQDSETGQLLEERAQAMESAADEFEALDMPEFDPGDVDEPEREEGESDEDFESRKSEAAEEAEEQHWQGLLEELQGVNIEAP